MEPLVTPNKDFYRIDTALTVPAPDPEKWVLRVTIACVSNEVGGVLVGNARWAGLACPGTPHPRPPAAE